MSAKCESEVSVGEAIFGNAQLGDRRRTARLVDTFELMRRHLGRCLTNWRHRQICELSIGCVVLKTRYTRRWVALHTSLTCSGLPNRGSINPIHDLW